MTSIDSNIQSNIHFKNKFDKVAFYFIIFVYFHVNLYVYMMMFRYKIIT